jgi:hypothetical protein
MASKASCPGAPVPPPIVRLLAIGSLHLLPTSRGCPTVIGLAPLISTTIPFPQAQSAVSFRPSGAAGKYPPPRLDLNQFKATEEDLCTYLFIRLMTLTSLGHGTDEESLSTPATPLAKMRRFHSRRSSTSARDGNAFVQWVSLGD